MTEPIAETSGELLTVKKELIGRESVFLRCEPGTTRAEFDALIAVDFREVGASGRCYNRQQTLSMLEQRFSGPSDGNWETGEYSCLKIAPDNYLLTYILVQGLRVTRRASLWRRTNQGWVIVYHQGTVLETS
jgi:hypothetical protein